MTPFGRRGERWLPILSGPWNLDEGGAISNLLAEEDGSWRITRCGVAREEKGGRLCTERGTIDDPQRGRKVCAEHRPHPVREKLLDKTLSMELQTSTGGSALTIGSGAGAPSAVCDQPMATDQVAIIYYDPNPVARSRTVSFHEACTATYERERAVMRTHRDRAKEGA
jgi:hypothetical protein